MKCQAIVCLLLQQLIRTLNFYSEMEPASRGLYIHEAIGLITQSLLCHHHQNPPALRSYFRRLAHGLYICSPIVHSRHREVSHTLLLHSGRDGKP